MWRMHNWEKATLRAQFLVVTDILLLSRTKTWELAVSGCSVWWSGESPNLPLLSSGKLLGAGRSKNCLFAWCASNWGPPSTHASSLKFPWLLHNWTHPKTVSGAWRSGFFVLLFKVPSKYCFQLSLSGSDYTLNIALNSKCKSIYTRVLTYDEEVHPSLLKGRKCGKTWGLRYILHKIQFVQSLFSCVETKIWIVTNNL